MISSIIGRSYFIITQMYWIAKKNTNQVAIYSEGLLNKQQFIHKCN